MSVLRSRDNARVRRWHALSHDGRARRAERRALIEGTHLVAAALDAGIRLRSVLISASGSAHPEIASLAGRSGQPAVQLSDALFRWVADTVTPVGLAAEIELPAEALDPARTHHAMFLDGIQDAGNVGAILRSAAAFGVEAAILGHGCADAWSPKVLRAAMGGHFGLRIAQVDNLAQALARFAGLRVCAVAERGEPPATLDLTGSVGWILGAEGQGVSPAVAALADRRVRVGLAQGIESLNVAAAAAILLYERARQLNTRAARS